MKKIILTCAAIIFGNIFYMHAGSDSGPIGWNEPCQYTKVSGQTPYNHRPRLAATSDLSKVAFFYNVSCGGNMSCVYYTLDHALKVTSTVQQGIDTRFGCFSASIAYSPDLTQMYSDFTYGSNYQDIYSWSYKSSSNPLLSSSELNSLPSPQTDEDDISLSWINDQDNNNNYLIHLRRAHYNNWWNQDYNIGQIQPDGTVKWADGYTELKTADGYTTFIDSSGLTSSSILQDGKYSLLNIGMDRSGGKSSTTTQSALYVQIGNFTVKNDGTYGNIDISQQALLENNPNNNVDYSCFSRSDYLDFENCYRVVVLYKKQNDNNNLYYQVGNETPYGNISWSGENMLQAPSDTGTQLLTDCDGFEYGYRVHISKDGQHIVFFAAYTNETWDPSVNRCRVYSSAATVNSDSTLAFSDTSTIPGGWGPQYCGHKGIGYDIALSDDGKSIFLGMSCDGLYYKTGTITYPAKAY